MKAIVFILLVSNYTFLNSSNDLKSYQYEFCNKLAITIGQAWIFLPFQSDSKLNYKLYYSGKRLIASVSGNETAGELYFAEFKKNRYLYIIPSNIIIKTGDSLIVDTERFKMIQEWISPIPAID